MIKAVENNSLRGSKRFGIEHNPESRLWKPVLLGRYRLENRIAMAPLTRYRAIGHVVNDLHVEYYSQRSSSGALIISEGTFISKLAGGTYVKMRTFNLRAE